MEDQEIPEDRWKFLRYSLTPYTVSNEDYELPTEMAENQPLRRECRVNVERGKETYEVIHVIPKGKTQIEAFRAD